MLKRGELRESGRDNDDKKEWNMRRMTDQTFKKA